MKHIYEVVSKAIKIGGQVAPASRANGAAVNSAAASRVDFSEAIVIASTGAASGSPTGIDVTVKIQHSSNQTTWTDYAIDVVSLTAANTVAFAGVDISGAKKFIRAVLSVSLSGGTSPEINCSAVLVLSGSTKIPA